MLRIWEGCDRRPALSPHHFRRPARDARAGISALDDRLVRCDQRRAALTDGRNPQFEFSPVIPQFAPPEALRVADVAHPGGC